MTIRAILPATLAVILVTGVLAPLAAQTPAYQWHTFYNPSETGWSGGNGKSVATDSSGNAYVVGLTHFPGTFAAPGFNPIHAVESNPYPYVGFIMKVNPAGQLLWYTFYHIAPESVVLDGQGVLVTGIGQFANDGLPPPKYDGVGPLGDSAAFVLKLDANGGYLWHTEYNRGGTATDIAFDPVSHNIYITGSVSTQWGGWPQAPKHEPDSPVSAAPYVLALSPAGDYLWHSIWGAGDGEGIAVDTSGNIFLTGHLSGNAFVARVYGPANPSLFGTMAWSRQWGGNRRGYDVATDPAGNVYAVGQAWPGQFPAGCPVLRADTGNPNAFIVKFDAGGMCQWYRLHGGGDSDTWAEGIAVNGVTGNVYVTGTDPSFGFLGDGNAASLHNNSEAASPYYDGGHFILGLDTSGAYQWHTFYGRYEWHVSHAIALAADGGICTTGGSGLPWLGDNNANPLYTQGGGDAVFLLKLALTKATPVVTWNNPAPIVFGSALGPAQLNATANVLGTFVYSPPAGTVLPVGNNQVLSVTFHPADSANYNSAQKQVLINILPAPAAPARIVVTKTLSRNGSNQVLVNLSISNTGGTAAANLRLTVGRIGTTSGTVLPQSLGNLADGGTVTTTLTFPASAGNPGALSVLTVGGTYTGGSFNSASRITLP